MSYMEILGLCEYYLGEDWFEYFYGEFPSALTPYTAAFDTLVECKREGWEEWEINNHPIYGIYINLAEYHPNMEKLLKHFPRLPRH
jgi:hypothetical protein